MTGNDKSYGTIPVDGARRLKPRISGVFVLRLGLSVALGAAALITIAALYRGGAQAGSNLGQKVILTADSSSNEISAPTEEMVTEFVPKGKEVMYKLKVKEEDTALAKSCEVAMYPCVAQVGGCILGRLTETEDKKISASTRICNCLIRGYTEPISLPDNTASFKCSYDCVSTILEVANDYVVSVNGAGNTLQQFCSTEMQQMAEKEFGNKNGYIPTDGDFDQLEVTSVEDPKVVLASEALAVHINIVRRRDCPALLPVANRSDSIVYAKRGYASGGRSLFKMEVVFDHDVYFANMAHLPKDEQLTNPSQSTGDPSDLGGRFIVTTIIPNPCGSPVAQQLAISATAVNNINKQNLPWKAELHAQFEGKPISAFGMGYKPMPKHVRQKYFVQLDTTDFTPPDFYDARDTLPNQVPCKAYQPMNQGACGSCYAFASATTYSARLCRFNPGSIGNTIIAPQELMDCTNGCNGGDPLTTFRNIQTTPVVEDWCDPYTSVRSTCGGACSDGNRYNIQPASVRAVGGHATAEGVLQMQLELMQNGPGVIGMMLYNDFGAYKSGVYVKSENATQCGGHAMTLVGFGVEDSIPYWLVQNSWGPNWGDNGFIKIRRGTNECGIESSGIYSVNPQPPMVCATTKCANGAITKKDCSCVCTGGWAGVECDSCNLHCQNGGKLDSDCTQCMCPIGYFGKECEGSILVTPLALCAGSPEKVTVFYSFGGSAVAPTQKTIIGIYPVGTKQALSYVKSSMLCGSTYDANVNGGLCPAMGSITITPPSEAGDYFVGIAPFLPPNEFGQSGYDTYFKPSRTLAQFTVLASACTKTELDVAIASNDPKALFDSTVKAIATAAEAKQKEMSSRLEKAQTIIDALRAQQPASIIIPGVDSPTSIIWRNGPPLEICWRLQQSNNVNPKSLIIFSGDVSGGTWWDTGLNGGGTKNLLPNTYQGCNTVSIATWLNPGTYTISVTDITDTAFLRKLAAVTFSLQKCVVEIAKYTSTDTKLTLSLSWSISKTDVKDTIKVFNAQGDVVYWFFTGCRCQTIPTTKSSYYNYFAVNILKANSVPGGYKVKYYPAGKDVPAGVAPQWINWNSIGW